MSRFQILITQTSHNQDRLITQQCRDL